MAQQGINTNQVQWGDIKFPFSILSNWAQKASVSYLRSRGSSEKPYELPFCWWGYSKMDDWQDHKNGTVFVLHHLKNIWAQAPGIVSLMACNSWDPEPSRGKNCSWCPLWFSLSCEERYPWPQGLGSGSSLAAYCLSEAKRGLRCCYPVGWLCGLNESILVKCLE